MIRFNLIFALILTSLFLSSCAKEGCTDESAENYNVTADKDDGSCVYCSGSTEQFLQTGTTEVTDDRFGSEYQNQVVLNITLQTKSVVYPLRSCGEGGCFLVVTATNTTNSVISNLQFNLPVALEDVGGTVYYFATPIVLNPGASHTYPANPLQSFSNGCVGLLPSQYQGNIANATYQ